MSTNKTITPSAFTLDHLSRNRTSTTPKDVPETFTSSELVPEYFFDAEDLIEVLKKLPKGTKVLIPNSQSLNNKSNNTNIYTDHGKVKVHNVNNVNYAILKSTLHWKDIEDVIKNGEKINVGY